MDTAAWHVAAEARTLLGESPAWDAASASLLWVDTRAGLVHRLDPRSGSVSTRAFDGPAAAVMPRSQGGLAVCLKDEIVVTDSEAGPARRIASIEPGDRTTRLNDAKADPRGRIWVGTMALDGRREVGTLYRVDPDASVTPVLARVTVSNGIAWSPDGSLMYYTDSATQRVDVLDYELATGTARERRTFVDLRSSLRERARSGSLRRALRSIWRVTPPGVKTTLGTRSSVGGLKMPDGLCVDADGGLWVALYLGGAICRYTAQGMLDRCIELPTSRITSCAFGGPELRQLYVTSARSARPGQGAIEDPLAGALFLVEPGVAGVPVSPYAG